VAIRNPRGEPVVGGGPAGATRAALFVPPERRRAKRAALQHSMRHEPRDFSWFTFRVANPTMRELFMYPQNPFRVKEALMSMLAGDIHGKTPTRRSPRALKTPRCAACASHPRRSLDGGNTRRTK
jgi:hypothetical protein